MDGWMDGHTRVQNKLLFLQFFGIKYIPQHCVSFGALTLWSGHMRPTRMRNACC